ncbi:UDP-glucuronic acid decarboxylase family protein [Haematospirillum jordaniae]|uniref:UDP-glucuronic acid decarboxylase family protein n=1 Tax=Haematospirillum jordaniae TaxID=1549855 RepID=UPI001432A834|nr:SDR family oxidoreductase [Haematospirillum jordaniae]
MRVIRRVGVKRVLVTGGAGFLGVHLCTQLLRQGYEVLCVDSFLTGPRPAVDHLLGDPHFTVMHHDITLPLSVDVDEIYNLACPASPVHYQRDPVRTIKTCVLGAMNMLELARQSGARVFQASTSEVYGDPRQHPQDEMYWGHVNPTGVRSCYDEGKRCAETLFFDYFRQHNLPIKVGRIFNTYGPGMCLDDGRVVSNFIVQALRGDDLTLFGDGSQTRSFCYVSDMITAFMRMMEMPVDVTGPFNLGNPSEISVAELAERILQLTGSHSRLVSRPLPPDDPARRQPDITRARNILGWEPTVSLEDGLRETIDWFRHSLDV